MAEFCKITTDRQMLDAPNPLKITISNPSDERYRYEGWLEKKYTEKPEYDSETQYLTSYWEQEDEFAVQHWEIHDIPTPPEPEPEQEEQADENGVEPEQTGENEPTEE